MTIPSRRSYAMLPAFGLALLLQTACASIEVGLGMRVSLDKTHVTSMSVHLPNGPGIAPGEKSALVVEFKEPEGSLLRTEGAGHGKVLWRDLHVNASLVTVNVKGIVSLSSDPRLSEGKMGHLVVTVPSHPNLHAELDIPVRYNYRYVTNFSGSDGSRGIDGSTGFNGTDGISGSNEPDNLMAGGDGSDGGPGGNGGDGSAGEDGADIQIRVNLRSELNPILQVAVAAMRNEEFYLIDPRGGSLTVYADGGSGGPGGTGGSGGQGGAGGDGTPRGANGRRGANGFDGTSGSRGQGGSITVIYDPKTKPYLGAIHVSSLNGPPTVFEEKPMTSLW